MNDPREATVRAREVLYFTEVEMRKGWRTVPDTGDLLLGLWADNAKLGDGIFEPFDLDEEQLREAVVEVRQAITSAGENPWEQVKSRAALEASLRGTERIDTTDLLLGLAHDFESIGMQALKRLDVTAEMLMEVVRTKLETPQSAGKT